MAKRYAEKKAAEADNEAILQKGWGVVMVPERHKPEAERLMSEIKITFTKEEEDETGQSG